MIYPLILFPAITFVSLINSSTLPMLKMHMCTFLILHLHCIFCLYYHCLIDVFVKKASKLAGAHQQPFTLGMLPNLGGRIQLGWQAYVAIVIVTV